MLIELGAGAACAAGVLAYGVRGRSSQLFGPSVWRGRRDRRTVALTFDDGPSETTPRFLELLAGYGVPATFFLCGQNVDRLPQVAREIAAAGHEVGNHSYSHARFDFKSARFIEDELRRAQDVIAAATGVRPALFRAPYGVRWFGLRAAQRKLNLLGVMWTVVARDWRLPSRQIAARLTRGAGNGAIFCLHDGRLTAERPEVSAALEATREIVPLLLDRGFAFGTVSGIIGSRK